jgi:GntR family transcriptional regulator
MQIKRVKNKGLSEEAKDAIYAYIKSMDIEKDNKLPREEVLGEMLGVSRITVRSALNELAAEGIIFRRQGKGTFVNPEAMQMKVTFNSVEPFMDMIKNSGFNPGIEVVKVETIKANEKIAHNLRIDIGDELISIEKVFYADDKPAAYCINYVAKKIIREHIEDSEFEMTIFDLLQSKTGRVISWDRVQIFSVSSEENEKLTGYFKCEGKQKPLLLCEGVDFDDKDYPVVYTYQYVDTKYIRFSLIRQKSISYE